MCFARQDLLFPQEQNGGFRRPRGFHRGGEPVTAASGVRKAFLCRKIAYLGTAMIGLGMGAEADVMPYLMSRYFGLRSFSELFGYAFSA